MMDHVMSNLVAQDCRETVIVVADWDDTTMNEDFVPVPLMS